MPINFSDLNIVEFVEQDGQRYFLKENESKDTIIKINYIPTTTSTWSKDKFDIYFFENGYLNAENDVYEIDYVTLEERIGWIFPITILESNENDYEDYKNLNNYKFIAYQKMLDLPLIFNGDDLQEYYTISDFFPDCMVCILSKPTISKIPGFKFDDTLLSFYNYGYLLLNEDRKSYVKAIFDRSDFISEMRSATRKKIVLRKTSFNIRRHNYISSLYHGNLLQSESHLIRFFFLYQVIEYLMQQDYDKAFALCLKEYNDGNISKNDFKEAINEISRERAIINGIFNKCAIEQDLAHSFIGECEILFDSIPKTIKGTHNITNMVYGLRNLVTHQLRDLTVHDEQLKKIVEIFERLLTNLLVNLPNDVEEDI